MLKVLRYQIRGFFVGVFVTVLVIGCMHYQIDFRIDPVQQELRQTEKLSRQQLASEADKFKKVPSHDNHQ